MLIKFRRSIATLLCVVLILGAGPLQAAASLSSDAEDHWASDAISYAMDKKIATGYEDGLFRPDQNVTRAEAAVIIQNVFMYEKELDSSSGFKDVPQGIWYENAVYALKSNNVISGLSADQFGPDSNLTRQDAMVIFHRAYGVSGSDEDGYSRFSDSDEIASYARSAISALVSGGYVQGRANSEFQPNANITRAELVQMVYMLEKNPPSNQPDEGSDTEEPKNETARSGSGGSGGSGGGKTPSGTIVDVEQTGIIEVDGLYFALISLASDAGAWDSYTYEISGHTAAASPVTSNQDLLKVRLVDDTPRTLSIKSGSNVVKTVLLGEMGESKLVSSAVSDPALILPSVKTDLVLVRETISLEQYLKFITVGNSLYIKPSSTLVTPAVPIEPEAIIAGADAVSSATTNVPPNFEDITEDAFIIVQYDLLINSLIVDVLGQAGSGTQAFLEKWNNEDNFKKLYVLNEDASLYSKYTDLSSTPENAVSEGFLPKYVKYMTGSGMYGTKINFATGQPDSTVAPGLTTGPVVIGSEEIHFTLSEENETWYRYLTELSFDEKYQYLGSDMHELSSDGLTLTLNTSAEFGPTRAIGTRNFVAQSFGFDDIELGVEIVNQMPEIAETNWNLEETMVELKLDTTSYVQYIQNLSVNGVLLSPESYSISGLYTICIPYRYLEYGTNEVKVSVPRFIDALYVIETPPGFVKPQQAPDIIVSEVIEYTNQVTLALDHFDSETHAGWWEALESGNVTWYTKYNTYTDYELAKLDDYTVTMTWGDDRTTHSRYSTYSIKIAIPGYDVVNLSYDVLTAAPTLTTSWSDNFSLMINTTDYSYCGSVKEITINDTPISPEDYKVNSYSIELYAENFNLIEDEDIEIKLKSNGYATAKLTESLPDDFTLPEAAPLLQYDTILVGEDLVIEIQEELNLWKSAITGIGVKRSSIGSITPVSELEDAVGESTITIPAKYLSSYGDYTLYIYAAGYKDLEQPVEVVRPIRIEAGFDLDAEVLSVMAYSGNYNDYTFLSSSSLKVVVNGHEVTDYTKKQSYEIHVPGAYFTEEENTLVLTSPGYQIVTLNIGKYEEPQEAPELSIEEFKSGGYTLMIDVPFSDWQSELELESFSLLKGTQNCRIEEFTVNEDGSLELTLAEALSSTAYTLRIAPAGYKTASITFVPYAYDAPELVAAWTEDGDLEIKGDFSYLYSTSRHVYLNGRQLTRSTDFKVEYYGNMYIYAVNFVPGEEYTIEIIDAATTSTYAKALLTVTAEEREEQEEGDEQP